MKNYFVFPALLFACLLSPALRAADRRPLPRCIAVVAKTDETAWAERMRQGVEAYAIASGDEIFLTASSQAVPEEQIAVIDAMIADRVDALCVVPVSVEECDPALARARHAGIRVVVLGRPVEHCDLALLPFENADVMNGAQRDIDWDGVYRAGLEGNPSGNAAFDPAAAAVAMIELALKLLNGESVADGEDLRVDGYHAVRIQPGEPRLVIGDARIFVD